MTDLTIEQLRAIFSKKCENEIRGLSRKGKMTVDTPLSEDEHVVVRNLIKTGTTLNVGYKYNTQAVKLLIKRGVVKWVKDKRDKIEFTDEYKRLSKQSETGGLVPLKRVKHKKGHSITSKKTDKKRKVTPKKTDKKSVKITSIEELML